MKFAAMIAGTTTALALSVSAQARALTGANTRDIPAVAKNYGDASLTTQSNGDPQITGEINGVAYSVYFRNCTDNKNCEDLNFYLGFLDIKPTLEEINDWNFNKRFSRAYLDQIRMPASKWTSTRSRASAPNISIPSSRCGRWWSSSSPTMSATRADHSGIVTTKRGLSAPFAFLARGACPS
ncbi:YbjN domain-containing protein [Devosia sp. A8/3-2]|nr:YbjN domain-containing protein [Devosia sp. A8/3-2]